MTSIEAKRLAKRIAGIERNLANMSKPQLAYSSIENGNLKSYEGNDLKMIVGLQDDGGQSTQVFNGPTPPTPIDFTVDVDHGKFILHWQGGFDGDALAPSDWSRAEVHASQDPFFVPSRATARGSIVSAAGGEVTIGVLKGPWTIKMVSWSQAGKMSVPSAPVDVEVPGYGDIVLEEIDAAQTRIDNARAILVEGQETLGEKLDESDTTLASLRDSLANLDETTLPALRQDLDAAEGRLVTAEGQITDAFGQLDAVPGQISDARQEAIDAALAELGQVEGSLVSSIDKKVNWSLDNPPVVFDGPTDATWFKLSSLGSGGQVKSQWRWNGNVWVSTILSEAVLAKIDIGTGTFGEMDGIRLKAGSVYADRIVSGLSQNMVPDPGFSNSEINASRLQRANTYGSTMSLTNGMLVVSAPSGVTRGPDFSLSANSDLYAWAAYPSMPVVAKAQARIVGAGSVCEFRYSIRFQLRDGTRKFVAMNPASYTSLTDEWVEVVGKYDLPQDAVGFSIVLQCRDNTVGTVEIRSPFVASSIGTTVIEPGAVTTDRLAADVLEVGNLKAGSGAIAELVSQKIASAVGEFLELDVGQLTVTEQSKLADVVAEKIAADVGEYIRLEVGQLVAGEGIMDEAVINKLFADVVVAGMSIASEFIGENAILTGAVTAPKITASEELWAKIGEFVKIRAEQIQADAIDGKVITGPIIQSARDGQRWVGDTTGIRIFNADNEVRTQLSPNGSTFKGEVEADTLVVNEGAEFKANNTLAQGAKLTLAAGVTDPTAPPVVQPFWEGLGVSLGLVSGITMDPAGLAWDGTNYWTAYKDNQGTNGARSRLYIYRINGTTGVGAFVGGVLPSGVPWSSEIFGITCIGSELFIHGRYYYEGIVWVTDLSGTYLRHFSYPSIGYSATNPLTYKPGIGNDGTNVVIAQCDDNGSLNIRTYNKTTGDLISRAFDTGGGTRSDITGVYVGNADWGRKLNTVAQKRTDELTSFNPSTGAYDGDGTKFNAAATGSTGVVFVDGKFRTLDPSGVIHEYADTNTGDASGDWWATYYWYTDVDDDGVIESSDYRSRMAPPARFTWPRRAGLKILGQPMPDGVEALGPALAKKTTTPVRTDFSGPGWQVDAGKSSARYVTLPTDWTMFASPLATNTFPEAESSVLESASGTFRLQGDGSGHWGPLTMGRNGVMSGLVVTGQASCAVDTAGTPKKFTVQLPAGRFSKPPVVWLNPLTSAPQNVAVSVVGADITATSFDLWFYRTDLTGTGVDWFATDSE